MSPDAPKIQVPAPPLQASEQTARSSALALVAAAVAAAISLVWGFETTACKGVVAGFAATLMRASFLALTHLPEWALLAMILAVHLGIAYLAALRPPFRGREELLSTLLPLASFLLGLVIANNAWLETACALHPWR